MYLSAGKGLGCREALCPPLLRIWGAQEPPAHAVRIWGAGKPCARCCEDLGECRGALCPLL